MVGRASHDVPPLQPRHERVGVADCTAGDIDEHAPVAQELKLRRAQEALGRRCERHQANHHLGRGATGAATQKESQWWLGATNPPCAQLTLRLNCSPAHNW
jgi:hypothetical protein